MDEGATLQKEEGVVYHTRITPEPGKTSYRYGPLLQFSMQDWKYDLVAPRLAVTMQRGEEAREV